MATDGFSLPSSDAHEHDVVQPRVSDVQATNLHMMQVIQLGLERNLMDTCRQYGLHADQASRLRALAPGTLRALAGSVGDISLFVPRHDLVALLDAPMELCATMAAARRPMPTLTSAPTP